MLFFVFVYLGMTALGLSLESMITILTPRFVPFFLFVLVCSWTASFYALLMLEPSDAHSSDNFQHCTSHYAS